VGVSAGWGLEAVLPALPALIRGALSGGTAAVLTLGIAGALGVAEVKTVTQAVARRLRRAGG